jgi:hypothetical protein
LAGWPLFFLVATISMAGAPANLLTPPLEEAVRRIIHRYLMENPEVMIEALQAYEAENGGGSHRKSSRRHSPAPGNRLERDPTSPVGGEPPTATSQLVEFTDYRCRGYCKNGLPIRAGPAAAARQDPLCVKELPILGPTEVRGGARAPRWRFGERASKYMAFTHRPDDGARQPGRGSDPGESRRSRDCDAKAVGRHERSRDQCVLAKNRANWPSSLKHQWHTCLRDGGQIRSRWQSMPKRCVNWWRGAQG